MYQRQWMHAYYIHFKCMYEGLISDSMHNTADKAVCLRDVELHRQSPTCTNSTLDIRCYTTTEHLWYFSSWPHNHGSDILIGELPKLDVKIIDNDSEFESYTRSATIPQDSTHSNKHKKDRKNIKKRILRSEVPWNPPID